MQHWLARIALSGVAAAGLGLSTGCGSSLEAALGTSDILNTTLGDLLGEVTASDVADAFARYSDVVAGAQAGGLSADELATVEDAYAALAAGEISEDDCAAMVEEALGDRVAGDVFAGAELLGHPGGGHLNRRLAAALDLTDEQIAAARQIFEDTHAQIRGLREQAIAAIRAVLTAEQQAILDAALARLRPHASDDGDDDGVEDASDAGADNSNTAQRRGPGRGFGLPGNPPGPRGGRGAGPGYRLAWQRLIDALDLTEEQQAAIQAIRDQLRADVEAAHDAARTAFEALLTADQLAILEQIRANHPRLPGADDDDAGDDADDES